MYLVLRSQCKQQYEKRSMMLANTVPCHFFPPLIKALSKISFSACCLFSLLETCSEWGQERWCLCIPEVLYVFLFIGQDCLRLPSPCKLTFPDRFLLSGEKQTNKPPNKWKTSKGKLQKGLEIKFHLLWKTARINQENRNCWRTKLGPWDCHIHNLWSLLSLAIFWICFQCNWME